MNKIQHVIGQAQDLSNFKTQITYEIKRLICHDRYLMRLWMFVLNFFLEKFTGIPKLCKYSMTSFHALKSILDSGKTISLLCTTLFGKWSLEFLWASFYDFCPSLEKPNEIEILFESWNSILIWRYNPSGKKQLV